MESGHSPAEKQAPVAMVLAAGFGRRLRPLTAELPKPLVPVGDRSVLAHILDQLQQASFERVVLNAHHLGTCFTEAVRATLPVVVSVVHEHELLGTAGGVAGAARELGPGPALIYNGDMLVEFAVADFCRAHAQSAGWATLAVGEKREPGAGTVGLGASGSVVRLRDGLFGEEEYSADFAGIQILSEAARRCLPDRGCLVGDLYMPALRDGQCLRVAEVVQSWTDIGTPERYLDANLEWLRARGEPAFVGEGAVLSGTVELEEVVVGAGARVEGTGKLRRCVIWPGAKVMAPLENAVVTTVGKVVQL